MPASRSAAWRALVALACYALVPARAQEIQAVFPRDPYEGMQVTYSLSGVSPRRTDDRYPATRTVEGRIAGNRLRITGLAKFSKGTYAELRVVARAGDQVANQTATLRPDPGQVAEQPFDVAVAVPAGAEIGSLTLTLTGHSEYRSNPSAVQVSVNLLGALPAEGAPVPPLPSKDAMATLRPVSEPGSPTEVALQGLLEAYRSGIPKGLVSSGPENNLLALWDDRYEEYTSGGFQIKVLALLDRLRTEGNPARQGWFEHWHYGPIQIQGGWHQAVVLWSHGRRWPEQGLVLDPWFTQTPQVVPIREWAARFGLTPADVAPSNYHPDYPTHGQPYADPTLRHPSPEESRWLSRQPQHLQRRAKALSPDLLALWVRQAYQRRDLDARLVVSGPVDAVLGDKEGRLTGFLEHRRLSAIPDLLAGRVSDGKGGWWMEFQLPTRNDLVAQFMGTSRGTALVYTASSLQRTPTRGSIERFSLPVARGSKHRLAEPAGTANPVIKGPEEILPERARLPISR